MGSLQYEKDISYYAPVSYKVNLKESIFSPGDIEHYKKLAKFYNKERIGDQAAFFIIKIR